MSKIYMSSRRTVMSGEVVTFATDFEETTSVFGGYRARGPFDISASRDAVMVHNAEFVDSNGYAIFILAVIHAEEARRHLSQHRMGGHPSQYPETPTLVFDGTPAASLDRRAEI